MNSKTRSDFESSHIAIANRVKHVSIGPNGQIVPRSNRQISHLQEMGQEEFRVGVGEPEMRSSVERR